ncbi:MAG: rod shape-determining protein MreC [Bacteroidota bacterium]
MNRLLQIIFQSGSFFTFVILELICFYLVINFNSTQRDIYLETVSVYTGGVNERAKAVGSYFSLRNKVDSLQNEIAALRARLPESSYTVTSQVDSISDDSLRQRYVYLAADIVNKSPFGPNNTFVINQGRKNGVELGQGVVAHAGLVGIVTAVSNGHARVMSLLHRDTRLSAGLKTNFYGTLRWDGIDPRYMTLTDMKDYVEVIVGDTIISTGYSNIFPTGIPIGTVTKLDRLPGTGNWKLKVELLNDPLQVRYVYVVKDLFKEDLSHLTEEE